MSNEGFIQAAPKGNRLHIAIFGRRNVGKSSLINALTRQKTAIVSDTAGTTTDPVEKPMEFLPLGPVLFIDTAGIDDTGELGTLRVEKSRQVLDRTDIAILVLDVTRDQGGWSAWEEYLLAEFDRRRTPLIIVRTKSDLMEGPLRADCPPKLAERKVPVVEVTTPPDGKTSGVTELRDALVTLVPDDFLTPPPMAADLLPPGELAILVTPIDKEAPKGRLILPEVQAIRDLLDHRQMALVVQTSELAEALRRVKAALVITDSQAFAQVSAIVPESIPLTSFSILLARQKGDFTVLLAGAKTIGKLGANAKILIAEACTHHPIAEDIGTVKIPRLLKKRLGESITIGHAQGHDFPDDAHLAEWDLVIHCGGCVWNRREMLRRISRCVCSAVPVTNYGLAIASLTGILDRAAAPVLNSVGRGGNTER
ncbi:MAG: [Thermoguttaceae bacterium]|nr:[FeFe] hydrogenase H-cluster maturation GTPase HydF [Thermoguttaceae bacterium]